MTVNRKSAQSGQQGTSETLKRTGRGSSLLRVLDGLSDMSGLISVLSLLTMTGMICFEVASRYLFGMPTSWAIEYATYLLVAVAFLGLSAAQRSGTHVQVEILVTNLSPERRDQFELVALWLSVLFVAMTAFQMIRFNYQEYIYDTRDWGLLSTPQWIPELPISIGLIFFAFALLADVFRIRPPSKPLLVWAVPMLIIGLVGALIWSGQARYPVFGSPLDIRSLIIFAAVILGALAWSGAAIAAVVATATASLCFAFYLAEGSGLTLLGLMLVGALLLLLLVGVRVGISMGLVGMFGLLLLLPSPNLPILADRAWASTNSFTLTAIPMFVLMGNFLIRSGITGELFESMVRWFGRTPGGIANASIGASAMFAAVSGSSLATAATLGQVAAPEMIKRGYSPRLTYGVVAAGATLGILIPPSIALIIYGNVVGVSITQLFAAGMIPGIVLAMLFSALVFAWSLIVPTSTPRGEAYPLSVKLRALGKMLPFLFLISAVLGSLYAGIATPTEAGGLGALVAMLLCLQRGHLSIQVLYETTLEAVRVTSMIMLIVVGAAIFSWVFDFLRLPRAMVQLVEGSDLAPWVIFVIICGVYLALGTIIESISMMLMTLSVTFPIIVALGFDPIWFGVVLVLLIEIGLVTPPVGIVLFVLRGISGSVPLRDIVLGVLPFVVLMLTFIGLLYAFPQIALWLPAQTR